MLDIHCHLLPCLDDGAQDMDTFIEMAKLSAEDGVDTIIATPHYRYGQFETSFAAAEEAVNNLVPELKSRGINITLLPGQEVTLSKYTLELINSGVVKGLAGSDYILLELPFHSHPEEFLSYLYEIKLLGYRIIIAHPERYDYIINKPSSINSILEEDCLFQLNAGSIKGIFGSRVKDISKVLLKHNIYSFIGTDAHGTETRSTKLSSALERLHPDIREKIIKNNEAVLNNEIIKSEAEKIMDTRKFFFFR